MHKKKQNESHYHVTYLLFLMLFLVVGVFVTVAQTQRNQNTNTHAATSTSCTVTAAKMQIKSKEQQLLDLVNQYRATKGAGKLVLNLALKQSSEWQSTDMLAHNNLSHTDSLGRTPDTRLINCGFTDSLGYGENIAEADPDPAVILKLWQSDVPHDSILKDPDYTVAGVSFEQNSDGSDSYWTMDFGITDTKPTQPIGVATITPTKAVPTTVSPTKTSPTTTIQPTITTSVSQTPTITVDPNVPTPTPAKVTADMQLGVKIKISGIGTKGNPSPKHLSRRVTATIFGIGTTPVTSGTAFLTYDGSDYFTGTIHLGKLAEGPYFITFVSDGTLQSIAKPEFQNLRGGQINVVPPVTLYLGDMDQNNILDINDYNLVLPCFQTSQCDSASVIDFNDDGKTDVTDYNLLLQSYQNFHGS